MVTNLNINIDDFRACIPAARMNVLCVVFTWNIVSQAVMKSLHVYMRPISLFSEAAGYLQKLHPYMDIIVLSEAG